MRKAIIFSALLIVFSSFVCATVSLDSLSACWSFNTGDGKTDDYNGSFTLSTGGNPYYNSSCTLSGNCWSFDGDDRLYFLDNEAFNFGDEDFTIIAWIRGNEQGGTKGVIGKGTTGSGGHRYNLGVHGGSQQCYVEVDDDTAAKELVNGGTTNIETGDWFMIAATRNSTHFAKWVNGVVEESQSASGYGSLDAAGSYFNIGAWANGAGGQLYWEGNIDEVSVWKRALTPEEIVEIYNSGTPLKCEDGFDSSGETTPPTILHLNCTSCITDENSSAAPYETEDTTPTFRFNTSEEAWCVIGTSDDKYTTMNATQAGSCTSGDGLKGPHYCSLPVKDRFTTTGENSVYISCIDADGNEDTYSTSGELIMNILGASETPGDDAIDIGIMESELWPCIVYSEQQVSARDLSNNQFSGVFDRVAVKDNTRWAFNYVSSGEDDIIGLFNLSPVLYVLQLRNLTNESITDQVGKLINDTYG
jgi:hypothetical protein